MLPTTGFFKDIDCPYYDTSCDRPYCHFRHRKRSQERADEVEASSQASEVPTYKPTPKSQLANTKSHIPISYVPDLVIRADRNFRVPSTYNYAEKLTYKPTPLSELSKTNKQKNSTCSNATNNSEVNEVKSDVSSSSQKNDEAEPEENINFEDLSMEFEMIDEIINDCNESPENDTKPKKESVSSTSSSSSKTHKNSSTKHETSSSSNKDKEREPSKSSKSKKSEHKHKEKSSTKHKHDHKKEHKSDKNKKSEDKHKSKSHKDDKHSHKSTHRDKERHREKEKHKHKEKSKKSECKKDGESKPRQQQNKDEPSEEDVPEPAVFSDDSEDLNDPSLEEECYRIFNEYKPEPVAKSEAPKTSEIVEEYVPTCKKRVAYHNAEQQSSSKIHPAKLKPVPNAALAMANRVKLARIAQATRDQESDSNGKGIKRPAIPDGHEQTKKLLSTLTGFNFNAKKPQSQSVDDVKSKSMRIAPVQNVNCIQQAKARIEEIARKKAAAVLNKATPMQTVGKGSKRVAHIPDVSLTDIPDVLQPENKKIPVNIRMRYLTMLADECAKLYLIKEDAYERALNEEVKVLERCAAITTYRNSAMLAINRIRKELQERESQGLGPILSDEITTSTGDSQYKGKRFYDSVLTYILNEEELELHGYPREGPVPGRAVINALKQMPKVNLDSSQRLCCRCFKVYLVDEEGFPLYEEECLYHPLKKRTLRGDRIYLCCKSTEDTGCVTSNTHVCEAGDADLDGFQTTMKPDREDDPRSYGVYSLDCEMCYTTRGLELTRVTIIDADCKTVYESLVKPLNPIVDYNTRFSGITKEQMDRTSTSILQVQANILHLCNSKTILIGHSLESDMKALKIIHSCIIDTSVMFPHRLGLPHKRALRVLASEYLRKIIQNDVAGHDSAEDALTCMELVQWKMKEDLKVRGVK